MNFTFDADQDAIRGNLAKLLADHVDLNRLTGHGNRPDTRYDPTLARALDEVGVPVIAIPEEYGGLGMTAIEMAIVAEEIGRALAPCAYLGNLAGTTALRLAGSAEQRTRLLPEVVSGACRFSLAHDEGAVPVGVSQVTARADGDRVNGNKRFVADADSATHLVVTALDQDDRPGFYLVETAAPEVEIDVLRWMDITRRMADVRLSGARAERLAGADDIADAWSAVNDHMLVALAAESAGGSAAVIDRAVGYAKERVQFGRAIGSYQAVKHKCADMFALAEAGHVLVYFGAWALGASDRAAAATAASMANAYTSDAYRRCTADAIQIHGGIGFTWEMPLHLYYKRARANSALLGGPVWHRENVLKSVTGSAGGARLPGRREATE